MPQYGVRKRMVNKEKSAVTMGLISKAENTWIGKGCRMSTLKESLMLFRS